MKKKKPKLKPIVKLYLKDHYSLQYRDVWQHFRTRETDNKLYILENRIIENGVLIGFECKEETKERYI